MSQLGPVSFDTEFNRTNQEFQNVVCGVCIVDEVEFRYWLLEVAERDRFHRDWDRWMAEGRAIICFNATAEARSLLALGYTFVQMYRWIWVDTYIWWKMLVLSHPCHRWGAKFVTRDGKRVAILTTPPPDGELDEDTFTEDGSGGLVLMKAKERYKAHTASLASALGHLFQVDINEEHKEAMVHLILEGGKDFTPEQREQILAYCAEDVKYLRPLARTLVDVVKQETGGAIGLDHLQYLSVYSVCNAQIENNGIPLDVKKAKMLSSNIPFAEDALISECVKAYPFYGKEKLTSEDKRRGKVGTHKWVEKKDKFMSYIDSLGMREAWPKTAKGGLRADVETLKDYSGDKILATYRTCKKSRNNLRYFGPDKWKKMEGNVGDDSRIRPGLRPFGTVTSRHTPQPSKGYILAMSTWLRTLIEKKGSVILSCDYSFEEMVLQAWASNCQNLMDACQSGDPYLWLAQYCGAINPLYRRTPEGYVNERGEVLDKDGQKSTHAIRGTYKSLMLGLGYGMGPESLSIRLTQTRMANMLTSDEQDVISKARFDSDPTIQAQASVLLDRVQIVPNGAGIPAEKKAVTYRDYHRATFSQYWDWRENFVRAFRAQGWASTPDGWCVFSWVTDQTAKNFYIQGTGQTILRRAVLRCLLRGLRVASPLHDALYVESTPENQQADMAMLVEEMTQAVTDICGSPIIRVDPKVIHTDWEKGVSDWTADKQEKEFAKLSKYMLF